MGWTERFIKWLQEKRKRSNVMPFNDGLETEQEYKERWRSIYVIYFTMFLISLGFSIILTGVWPYLDKLDPTAGKEFMGYVVAANPFGQMLFSPLMGWWGNKLGSIRLPLLISLTIFAISSAVYSSLELFDSYHKYWMLWARFLVGVSSANVAVCRSYLSAATRLSERTNAISMISLMQVLGFVIGPALQAVVVPLGDAGIWLIPDRLKLNMYTAAGWINVFLSLMNIIFFMPSIFKERKIAAREAMIKHGAENEKATWKGSKPDYLAAWTLIVLFFVLVFNFMLLETLGAPMTMDQFGWSKAEALYYMGILMSVGAICACVTFVLINPLCNHFAEVKVMVWGGFLFMVLGRAVYIPMGSGPPPMYDDTFKRSNTSAICDALATNVSVVNNGFTIDWNLTSMYCAGADSELVGCPSSQEWCAYTPAMTLVQFVIGYGLTVLGYPMGVTLIQTIFSKVLGPRPQGVWMGFMTGSGCLSRVMGPVFVTYVYTEYGTVWTFGLTTVMMMVSMVWLLFCKDRLVPIEDVTLNTRRDVGAVEMQEVEKFVPDASNAASIEK